MMNLIFLAALFFVVIFAVVVQLITKCPLIPAAIVALVSLIVYAFLSETLGTVFIVWIIIYTLAALLAAFLTCLLRRNNCCRRCNERESCSNCNNCNSCARCNLNDGCNNCNDDF